MGVKDKQGCGRAGYEVPRSHTAGTVTEEIQDVTQGQASAGKDSHLLELGLIEEIGFMGCGPWWAEPARSKGSWEDGCTVTLLESQHSGGWNC